MRGKPHCSARRFNIPRITPACAGKTVFFNPKQITIGDHPRVCGENFLSSAMHPIIVGLPPRVRGKHGKPTLATRFGGITPACAGKTTVKNVLKSFTQDHPRVCGENKDTIVQLLLNRGSPPRVRGKRVYSRSKRIPRGITPACAGKT